jgi:predicted ribosome quality control (RQC) complex YloA/Tae2 family protein
MRIALDIRKSIEENAAAYFEKAKKDKKKLEGARKIVDDYKKKLTALEQEEREQQAAAAGKKPMPARPAKKEWFEKFRWFFSSDGFLVIGGRDATTNEIVIKKYTENDDLVFHTEAPGSPFVVVKHEGKAASIPDSTLEEAAVFTAAHSKAWKQGLSTMGVFLVKPEQVSKSAKAGEFIPKGAFMIYGEKKFYHPQISYAVGVYNGKVMGGPLSAIKKHCQAYVEVVQGDDKLSDVAKQIKKQVGGEIDDIIRALPASGRLKKS